MSLLDEWLGEDNDPNDEKRILLLMCWLIINDANSGNIYSLKGSFTSGFHSQDQMGQKMKKWTTGTREAQLEEQEGRWRSLPLPLESLLHSWQQCTPQVRQGSLTTDSAEHLFWLLALQHGGHHPRHYQCHAFGQCSIAGRNPTVVSFTPARCFDKDMLT